MGKDKVLQSHIQQQHSVTSSNGTARANVSMSAPAAATNGV